MLAAAIVIPLAVLFCLACTLVATNGRLPHVSLYAPVVLVWTEPELPAPPPTEQWRWDPLTDQYYLDDDAPFESDMEAIAMDELAQQHKELPPRPDSDVDDGVDTSNDALLVLPVSDGPAPADRGSPV